MIVYQDQAVQLLQGDVMAVLKTLPDNYVQTVVTSPPYWGLRDYKMEGQLGLEIAPELYVVKLVEIFREVRRVLKKDGTLWLNLGDSYGHGTTGFRDDSKNGAVGGWKSEGNRIKRNGIKAKDLVGIPWRVAFALQADGWYLRSDIIWSKPNPMPESVTDRPTKAHEYLFLLTKSPKYYYDNEAIKEPAIYAEEARYDPGTNGLAGDDRKTGKSTRRFAKEGRYVGEKFNGMSRDNKGLDKQRGHGRRHAGFNDRWDHMTHREQCSNMRNKRSVWTVGTAAFPDAHFATFPEALIEPCILAGAQIGGLVLDPFSGAGTTLLVSKKLNRTGIGIELNPDYCAMSAKRLQIEPARLL